jgi:hypothetical protein
MFLEGTFQVALFRGGRNRDLALGSKAPAQVLAGFLTWEACSPTCLGHLVSLLLQLKVVGDPAAQAQGVVLEGQEWGDQVFLVRGAVIT